MHLCSVLIFWKHIWRTSVLHEVELCQTFTP